MEEPLNRVGLPRWRPGRGPRPRRPRRGDRCTEIGAGILRL